MAMPKDLLEGIDHLDPRLGIDQILDIAPGSHYKQVYGAGTGIR